MHTKQSTILFSVLSLIAGVLFGTFVFGASESSTDHDSMTSAMHGMTSSLEGKTGDSFDKAFIDEMIVHHEGAVAMAESALTNAKHQEIKDMARAIISAQTSEISQMREWKENWYK